MEINQLLTKRNFEKATNRKIEYIVIHYVGATGTAKGNCQYFQTEYRGVSAHYFVGHEGDIWQCVLDKDIAWHCGANKYVHKYCRNSNSIGIEMCCREDKKGNWYFEDKTVEATIELTKELMKKYNIPADRVIRHYDVSGKICPAPYVKNNTKHTWDSFTKKIKTTTNSSSQQKSKISVKDWQVAAIADGFKFPKAGADGKWGPECESVAKSAVVKKRLIYKYKNLTKLVQKALGIKVDGYCGKDTDKAIRAYQKANNLTVDGSVGPATWKKLLGQK